MHIEFSDKTNPPHGILLTWRWRQGFRTGYGGRGTSAVFVTLLYTRGAPKEARWNSRNAMWHWWVGDELAIKSSAGVTPAVNFWDIVCPDLVQNRWPSLTLKSRVFEAVVSMALITTWSQTKYHYHPPAWFHWTKTDLTIFAEWIFIITENKTFITLTMTS